MSHPKKTGVVVMAEESFRGRLAPLAAELKKKGLRDATLLDAINIVTGSVDPEKIGALRAVPGVHDVVLDEEKKQAGTAVSSR